ncbi:HTH_Tnp_Tc3_2 domain-containing protein [Trichonephila clavipes]|nr:HTH_Tnp_Tc3_2 domain-containing protein [Trichonephila clavipes]
MKTRLRTPSTSQSSRRSQCRKKCTHTAIKAQVTPSLRTLVSSRTTRRTLKAERHLGSWCPLRVLPLTPAHRRLRLECAVHEETGLEQNGTRWSFATNLGSISAMMTIVFVCGDPVVNASILPLLYSDIPLTQLV